MTASEIVSHPTCAQHMDHWLERIATPVERARAEELIRTIRPEGLEACPELPARPQQPTQLMHTQATAPKGWCYSATKSALQRTQDRPLTPTLAREDSIPQQDRPSTPLTSRAAYPPPPGQPRPASAAPTGSYDPSTQPIPQHVLNQLAAAGKVGGGKKGSKQASAQCEVVVPPDITTYHLAFHLAQLYPDLYAEALAGTKALPSTNNPFLSDWGESLKVGGDSEWRARFLRSVYHSTNDEVYPDSKAAASAAGSHPPGEAGFFRWLQRQQTYYQGLIKAGLLPAVDAEYLQGTPQQQRALLGTLRQLNAVARPELLISHSQAVHGPMRPCEDPELTTMVKEQTRIRTMGFPPPQVEGTYLTLEAKMRQKQEAEQQQHAGAGGGGNQGSEAPRVDIVFDRSGSGQRPFTPTAAQQARRRPSTAVPPSQPSLSSLLPRAAAMLASQSAAGERQRPASASPALPSQAPARVTARPKSSQGVPKKETFTSKIPLKWAAAQGAGLTSTYTDAFGSLAGGAAKKLAGQGVDAVRYREVTCPIGAVNSVTALVPARQVYAVPHCFTQTKAFPQGPGDVTMSTVSRTSFAARAPEDVLRTLKAGAAAKERVKAAKNKSGVPLGKNAVSFLATADWASEKQAKFLHHHMDVQGDYERAQRLKDLLGGPTAAVGKMTAAHKPSVAA